MTANDAIAQFREAIVGAGLPVPDRIEADGMLHRFSTNGRKSDDGGWYVLHCDGIPAGAFGCWRSGVERTWRADVGRELSDDEKRALRERMEAARREREAERRRRQERAANWAREIWPELEPAPADQPYLALKGVKPYGLRVFRGELVIGGVDCNVALIVPARDSSGELHSLEFITADGEKRYLPDGRIAGMYHAIGEPRGVLY